MAKQRSNDQKEGDNDVVVDPGGALVDHGTRTDDNVTEPSTVQPGDAPADTMDPNERVSSVPVRPGEQAIKEGTVNAVLVNPNLPDRDRGAREAADARKADAGGERTETYTARRPDGTEVRVTRNIETGESTVEG